MMLRLKTSELHLNLATVTIFLSISHEFCGGNDLDRYIGCAMLRTGGNLQDRMNWKIRISWVHKARLTPELTLLFESSNDCIGASKLSPTILRTLRVARSELEYTGWMLHEKNSMRVGKAPTTADAEVERDV